MCGVTQAKLCLLLRHQKFFSRSYLCLFLHIFLIGFLYKNKRTFDLKEGAITLLEISVEGTERQQMYLYMLGLVGALPHKKDREGR